MFKTVNMALFGLFLIRVHDQTINENKELMIVNKR